MQKKINLTVSEGDAFYAHQASINFNPTMFHFDFKNITPRVDERTETGASLVMKHNVVMLEPYHVKLFKDLLDKVVKDYEKEFGKIEKPKAIKNIEKKGKNAKKSKSTKPVGNETPTYFG